MTTTRTGSGATAIRPATADRPIAVFDKQEFTGRPVDGQEVAAVGQRRRGRPGRGRRRARRRPCARRVSTTERLPLRRLAASSVLPPSTTASATGWRSRRAASRPCRARPPGPARARSPGAPPGRPHRSPGGFDGVLMASPGPSWRIAAAAVEDWVVARAGPFGRLAGPCCKPIDPHCESVPDPREFVRDVG